MNKDTELEMDGAYRIFGRRMEWVEGEVPRCERCLDIGDWVAEDSPIDPCPDCSHLERIPGNPNRRD